MGILGYVLTQIYNQSFRNLLKAKILDPLNMNSTHVPVRFSDLPKSTLTCIATPHASGVVVSHWELASLVGAGAMISSAEDLIRFGTAHWDGNTPTGLAASLAEVAKPRLNDHGLGWEIHNDSLTKGGGTGGFRAHVNVNPKDKTTHVILSNSGGVSNEVTLEGEFSSMQGYWSGDLITRVRKRRLVCCINIDGRMVLYGLIRGNHPALSARSKFSDDHFYFSFPSIKTVYEGTVEDGELSGALTFSDGHCDTLTLRYSTEMPSDLRAGLHETMQGNLTSISGYWWGYLGGVKGLFIYVSITRVGELSVIELFSPDQHNQPISISTASFINDTFKIRSDQINSEFSGKLAGDGKSIKGTWNQHQSTPLTLYLSTQRPEREKRDTSAI